MSDPLKDAMSRAVDRIAPFPPNADALKRAAKRSQLRRRIVGGYLGLMLAGWLGTWAVSTINDNPDTERGDRRPVAGPISSPTPEETTRTYTDDELGFSVTYPGSWVRTEEPVTKMSDTKEILTLGTTSRSISDKELGDCAPPEVLSRLDPDGALIYVLENDGVLSGPLEFNKWPSDFGLDDLLGPSSLECWGREIYSGLFRDSGRSIGVYVALGDGASPERQLEASDILGSLQIRPLTPLKHTATPGA